MARRLASYRFNSGREPVQRGSAVFDRRIECGALCGLVYQKKKYQISSIGILGFAALLAIHALLVREVNTSLQLKLLQLYVWTEPVSGEDELLAEPDGLRFVIEAMQLAASYFVYLLVIWGGLWLGSWLAKAVRVEAETLDLL